MTQKQLKSLSISILSLLIIIGSLLLGDTAVEPNREPELFYSDGNQVEAVVERVIDGDTIKLTTGETIRYIGIDTPETKHPSKGKECFGPEATQANTTMVDGKTVTIVKDTTETDRYDRVLGYVYVQDTLVNEALVKEGFARSIAYPPDITLQDQLDQAQAYAQEQNLGLWKECN
jgi:micrococcal nuclease